MMGLAGNKNFLIEIVNLEKEDSKHENIKYHKENVLELTTYFLCKFDIIHSNSLIEHLSSFENQKKFADLILKSGVKYFIQTPNYYFPFEPHFLFPLFQFLPLKLQILLLKNFKLCWFNKCKTKADAVLLINSIRLLKRKELKQLFPNSKIYKEKLLFLVKSHTLN